MWSNLGCKFLPLFYFSPNLVLGSQLILFIRKSKWTPSLVSCNIIPEDVFALLFTNPWISNTASDLQDVPNQITWMPWHFNVILCVVTRLSWSGWVDKFKPFYEIVQQYPQQARVANIPPQDILICVSILHVVPKILQWICWVRSHHWLKWLLPKGHRKSKCPASPSPLNHASSV